MNPVGVTLIIRHLQDILQVLFLLGTDDKSYFYFSASDTRSSSNARSPASIKKRITEITFSFS